jgi:membrane-associated protein
MTLESTLRFASEYGYWFLFAASLAENLFLLGCVVPGDLVVVVGGGMVATGHLQFAAVLGVVFAGVVLGSFASFGMGRVGGMRLIERWGARFAVGSGAIRSAQDYFIHHGAKTVFAATFVAGLKNLVPALAGASRMPFARFAVYNLAGSVLRSAGLLGLGYFFGVNVPLAIALAGKLNLWLAALIAVVAVGALLVRHKRRRRTAPGVPS